MKVVATTTYLLMGLLLGLGGFVIRLEQDAEIKGWVRDKIQKFYSEQLGADFECTVTQIGILFPCVEMIKCTATDQNAGWQWSCSKLRISTSIIQFLLRRRLQISGSIKGLQVKTQMKGGWPLIFNHASAIMRLPSLSVEIDTGNVSLPDAKFEGVDQDGNRLASLNFKVATKTLSGNKHRIQFVARDGYLNLENFELEVASALDLKEFILEEFTASAEMEETNKGLKSRGICLSTMSLQPLFSENFSLSCNWNEDLIAAVIRSRDGKTILGPLTFGLRDGRISEIKHHAVLYKRNKFPEKTTNEESEPYLESNSTLFRPAVGLSFCGTAELIVRNLTTLLPKLLKLEYSRELGEPCGQLTASADNQVATLLIDTESIDGTTIKNNKPIILETLEGVKITINAEAFKVWISKNRIAPKLFDLSTEFTLSENENKGVEHKYAIDALGKIENGNLVVIAKIGGLPALSAVRIESDGKGLILNLIQGKRDENSFVRLSWEHKRLEAKLDYQLLEGLIEAMTGTEIKGEGLLEINGWFEGNNLGVVMAMKNSNILLASTYDIIRGLSLSGTFNLKSKLLQFNELSIETQDGRVSTHNASVNLTDEWTIASAIIPINIGSLLIARGTDFITSICGRLLFDFRDGQAPKLSGYLSPSRTVINGEAVADWAGNAVNIVNSRISQIGTAGSKPLELGLTLELADPIKIKTGIFKAAATGKLQIIYKGEQLETIGTLSAESGRIKFPYKSLYLTTCNLYFLPYQPYDPIVELECKGQLRKYTISLTLNGSVRNPYISLQSSPHLSEEQIIMLLMAGTTEGSIDTIIPSLLLTNLGKAIFSPENKDYPGSEAVSGLLSQFGNIRLYPTITESKETGGFRGGVEVELGEQWRGAITKEIGKPESTKVELEYLVSDDVSLKAVRNERGELSGEIEIRWRL